MLCPYCSNIGLDHLISNQGYQHHSSADELRASAKEGCEFCTLILTASAIDRLTAMGKTDDLTNVVLKTLGRSVTYFKGETVVKSLVVGSNSDEVLLFTTRGICAAHIENFRKAFILLGR